ncbi:DNA-binding protein [Campylobacter sp. 7477a]|uniref:DNA-binding protein n=1 Tax=Campylobacter sp. 7477a TaxID=2735741 RepID=UPI00301568DB|nr:DNA-binding protein [Campylobacter sp. 7477a]
MQKLPVNEAANVLGVTKEAVYNRIRRGSLKSVEKDGQKFVVLDDADIKDEKPSKKRQSHNETTNKQNGEFVRYLIEQLNEVKALNLNLQADKDRLFKEKEQMLIESKNEISQIYKERDEKLMVFLKAMERPFLTHVKSEETAVEAVVDEEISEQKWISLSEFLREFSFEPKKQKKAQNKIIKHIGRSKFIKFKQGVILIRKDKTLKELIGEK